MTAETLVSVTSRDLSASSAVSRAGFGLLRSAVIACGVAWSLLFIYAGLRYRLQLYGDGSVFSYAVAVQDAWTVHWHNISGRLSVYLICFVPAEAFVALTGNAAGGIAVYGFLFFAAQLAGLIATFAADRSKRRTVFCFACFSTACVCPLVFGFPTEMWIAHALFWPALAVAHFARRGVVGSAMIFVLLLALAFTHEGALVLVGTILLTVLLRGGRGPAFVGAAASCAAVLAIWFAVKTSLRPNPRHRRAFSTTPNGISSTSELLPADCLRCWPARSLATAPPSWRCGDCCRNAPSFAQVRSSWCRSASIGFGSINRFMRKTGIFCARWFCSRQPDWAWSRPFACWPPRAGSTGPSRRRPACSIPSRAPLPLGRLPAALHWSCWRTRSRPPNSSPPGPTTRLRCGRWPLGPRPIRHSAIATLFPRPGSAKP